MEQIYMKKFVRILVPLLLLVVILASCVWYLFSYDRAFTRDTLLSQARYNDLYGNSRLSSWFYNLAYTFSNHDGDVAIELADQYKQAGNYTKAEYTLTIAIYNSPSAELYTALSKTYVEQDKLLDAVALLDNVKNDQIRQELAELRPTAPAPDQEPGYFSQYIDLALSSAGSTIYYTTDGQYPSIRGSVYQEPISLGAGKTDVYAVAVDENGLASPLSVLSYTITGVIEKVEFVDGAMEAAIRQMIGADTDDDVYTNQLWNVTEFVVPEGVASYEDLAQLPYLELLTIHDQNPTLSSLSSLSRLKTLDLTGCRFPAEDLSALVGLPALTDLNLTDCNLSTIEGLTGATNLECLNLEGNTIRNLQVLSHMKGLRELELQHNAVTGLEALSSLTELEKLNISNNAVTSLEPLAACVMLSELTADSNQLTSLSGLEKLVLLTKVSVDHNALTDVSILAGATELTDLSISSNAIESISALSTLTRLKNFDFSSNKVEALPAWPDGCALQTINGSYNAISNIDGLRNMESLSYIYMEYNLITDIDALADCVCLVQLNVFGNEIEDASELRERGIIVNYDPT